MTAPEPGTEPLTQAMRRALALAANGPAWGANPRVGCVILGPDGSVLSEGWHRGAGTAHAEVDALSRLAPDAAHGATAVVTLEPCNHTGRTGPCSQALIEAGIARVVYAVSDPGANSSGGAQALRAAGIEVIGGILEDEVEAFLYRWLGAMRLGRPWVIAKWASSLDGRAAADDGSSQWITGAEAREDVHLRRSQADAIVIGTGTLLADDPSLTARSGDGSLLSHQPRPVVIGEREVPGDARLHQHPHELIRLTGHDLPAALDELWKQEVRSVFIEGGPTLSSAFIAAGLVDEYLIYLAPMLLGGGRVALGEIGVPGIDQARRLRVRSTHALGDDLLVIAHPLTSRQSPHEGQ